MKNKEIKKNTTNSNFYEGVDDKGCHFSFQQNDTGSEEDKKWWNEQVSWHAQQVAEHQNQVPHSQTVSFTHRRQEGEEIFENTRVFEISSDGNSSSAKISEITDDGVIDNQKSSQSVKRQRASDEENCSVKKRGGESGENKHLVIGGQKQVQSKKSQSKNSTDNNSVNDKRKEDKSEEIVFNGTVNQDKRDNSQVPIVLGLGGGFIALITAFGVRIFKK